MWDTPKPMLDNPETYEGYPETYEGLTENLCRINRPPMWAKLKTNNY